MGKDAQGMTAAVASRIPTLGLDRILTLLESDDPRQILLGIFASDMLEAIEAIGRLSKLREHPDAVIAKPATTVYDKLIKSSIETGARWLEETRARRPGQSVIFPYLGDAAHRRQIIRWMIRDNPKANDSIVEVLRSALNDPDWEVRVTAMLAAARLNATQLGKEIRKIALPNGNRDGIDREDASILRALQKATLDHLAGVPFKEPDAHATLREQAIYQLRRSVAGLEVERLDRVPLLVHSLTEPLELDAHRPPALSRGVVEKDGKYWLAHSGIEMCWVAPIPHWLGGDNKNFALPNPIRIETPAQGFFVAKRLMTGSQVSWTTSERLASADSGLDSLYLCDWGEARKICDLLSQIESLPITLPTAGQWEMAARGPDGRLHPWGNGYHENPSSEESPWGGEQFVGVAPQWTDTRDESGLVIACGADRHMRCAARLNADIDGQNRFAIRPVIVMRP